MLWVPVQDLRENSSLPVILVKIDPSIEFHVNQRKNRTNSQVDRPVPFGDL